MSEPETVRPIRLTRSSGGGYRLDAASSSTIIPSSAPSWASRTAAAPAPRPAGRAESQVSVSVNDLMYAAVPYIASHSAKPPDCDLPVLETPVPDQKDGPPSPNPAFDRAPLNGPLACGCCCAPHHSHLPPTVVPKRPFFSLF